MTHAPECSINEASGGDGEEVLNAENVSSDEAAVEDDSVVTDVSDSHVANPDSPVERASTDATCLKKQSTDTQRRLLRYSLRVERYPPDHLYVKLRMSSVKRGGDVTM